MGKANRKHKVKAKKTIAAFRVPGKNNNKETADTDEQTTLLHKIQTGRKTITKIDKTRSKHKNFIDKCKNIAKRLKGEASKKKREQSAITGDLKPLKDALPLLDELFELSRDRTKIRTGVEKNQKELLLKLSAKKKLNRKKREFISKVGAYEALLKDPDFKKNPRATISYHVKYTNGVIDQ